MRTKVDIEIVTGFLGAGKTYFINTLIKETYLSFERVLIIQNEKGMTSIDDNIIHSKNINVEVCEPSFNINAEYIKTMIEKYTPHRIIIEYNGTKNLVQLVETISQELSKTCRIASVFYLADILSYEMFFSNMPTLILPCIYHSNLIVLNNCTKVSKDKLRNIKTNINKLNKNTFIADIESLESLEKELQYMAILDGGFLKFLRITAKIILSKIAIKNPRREY
ncbi:GTP-binding protein [Clostridium manihotivorum]|uniref:Cobalamin biosynthesis protein n=1 Tax=Clostridium manihotivorum TaxID=2320868 RepID=A0A3R5WZM6_9CLOT|nr:GTP-binding protein [Clostridium manihotivorum]QAA30557.1 cobalamin biosynthesis protein [Clostridium manihotivorum]